MKGKKNTFFVKFCGVASADIFSFAKIFSRGYFFPFFLLFFSLFFYFVGHGSLHVLSTTASAAYARGLGTGAKHRATPPPHSMCFECCKWQHRERERESERSLFALINTWGELWIGCKTGDTARVHACQRSTHCYCIYLYILYCSVTHVSYMLPVWWLPDFTHITVPTTKWCFP